jgi:uncharacterized membrane protein
MTGADTSRRDPVPAVRSRRTRIRRPGRLARAARSPGTLLLAWFTLYALVGYKVVVHQHVVVPDGWARLAHAYLVFYNDPPKLVAIGFIWPPVPTLVYLPFAWLKPLATSLVALPLTSALFGAGLLLALDRTLRLCGMRRRLRYPVLAAFGLNPMILCYATNGMGEIVALFFLATGICELLAWHLHRRIRSLALAALSFAVACLCRYELIVWAAVATVVLVALLARSRPARHETQASVIAFVLPTAYALGLWCFLSWVVIGDPIHWLRSQTSRQTGVQLATTEHPPAAVVLKQVVALNTGLYFPVVVALLALLVVVVTRRDVMAAALATFLALNAVFTAALFAVSNNQQLFELRYNMRGFPLVIAAVAWLYLGVRSARGRRALWVSSIVVLVLSIPVTWHTMMTSTRDLFLEDAYLRALPTLRDQTGRYGHILGVPSEVSIVAEQAMARYVRAHVHRPGSVLTDDAATLAVIHLDGRPEVYRDRIDTGDAIWKQTLADPWGKVDYLLVAEHSYFVAGAGPSDLDLVFRQYPTIFTTGVPGFTVVHRNEKYTLFRVAAQDPRPQSRPPSRPPGGGP